MLAPPYPDLPADLIAAIEALIQARWPQGRACVLGINGVDTAGKTIFAQRLREALQQRYPVALIHGDDFHHPRAIRYQHPNPVIGYLRHAFDVARLERELLAPIQQGATIDSTLTLLDLATDTYTLRRHYTITPQTVVLLEGVLLYRPPLDRYFDARVFLTVSEAEALRRATLRDGPEMIARYRARYNPAQRHYLSTHRPRERSHLVIDNDDATYPRVIKSSPAQEKPLQS